MKKLKKFSIVIALVFCFTCYGQLPWQTNPRVYASPLLGGTLLTAGGAELLIAAAPYVLAGAVLLGGGYYLYKSVKRNYLQSKVYGLVLDDAKAAVINNLGAKYMSSTTSFDLDVKAIPLDVMQQLAYSMTQNTSYSYSMQDTNNPLSKMFQGQSDVSWSYAKSFYEKYSNLKVDIVSEYVTDGYASQVTRSYGSTMCFSIKPPTSGASYVPAQSVAHHYTISNVATGKSTDFYAYRVTDGTNFWYADHCVSAGGSVWSDMCVTPINTYQYNLTYSLQSIADVVGVALADVPKDLLALVGAGSICVSPKVIDGSKVKAVDVPTSVPVEAYPTRSVAQDVALPTAVTGADSVSIPTTQPIAQPVPVPVPTDYAIPDSISLDFSPFKAIDLTKKFPFSIPWDIVRSFKSLAGISANPPKWTLDFSTLPASSAANKVVIDFSMFEKLAMVVRWGILVIFNIGLILKTREILRG